ncbi:hypothetical protein PR048_023467 [Dryococelus australis]|uniref:Uncharacterized protein n=1 Tax=Dryococelus australis TaxID=614101 RepID=A0ABQ9GU91_9NEOP|nr:hypothetical protein PR048_023467 [Dryococelus australis]
MDGKRENKCDKVRETRDGMRERERNQREVDERGGMRERKRGRRRHKRDMEIKRWNERNKIEIRNGMKERERNEIEFGDQRMNDHGWLVRGRRIWRRSYLAAHCGETVLGLLDEGEEGVIGVMATMFTARTQQMSRVSFANLLKDTGGEVLESGGIVELHVKTRTLVKRDDSSTGGVTARTENWGNAQLIKTCVNAVFSEVGVANLWLKMLEKNESLNQILQNFVMDVFGYPCSEEYFTQIVLYNLLPKYIRFFMSTTRPTTMLQLLALVTEVECTLRDCADEWASRQR